jgi:predicted O-methyltransferase YrrM
VSASGRIQAVLERVVREGTVRSRADGAEYEVFPIAASPAEGAALRDRVLRSGATRTVETGLGYGISALFLCDGLVRQDAAAPRHVAIDPFQDSHFGGCGRQLLEEAGVWALVEHHAGESQLVLPELLRDGRRFDLAFVDGNHRFDAVFLDLVFLGRLLEPGSVAFLDDYQLPAVQRAASFCITNLGWSLEEVSAPDEHHRWAVLRTSTVPDERPWDHFVDF